MIGDAAASAQVAVELGGVYEQHVAGVGEALAAPAVGLELFRQAVVDAGEVADGYVVLGVGEPPQRHVPGITGIRLDRSPQAWHQPGEDRLAIGGREFAGLPRRHPARFDLLANGLPRAEVAVQVGCGDETVEGHGRLRLVT